MAGRGPRAIRSGGPRGPVAYSGSHEEVTRMITTDVYPGKDLGGLDLTVTDEMIHH